MEGISCGKNPEQNDNQIQQWSFLRFQIRKKKETHGIFGDNWEGLVMHCTLDNVSSMPKH